MCLDVLLSNDHSGMKDSKPLSFPSGRLWRDNSGLPVVLVLGLGDCEEPQGPFAPPFFLIGFHIKVTHCFPSSLHQAPERTPLKPLMKTIKTCERLVLFNVCAEQPRCHNLELQTRIWQHSCLHGAHAFPPNKKVCPPWAASLKDGSDKVLHGFGGRARVETGFALTLDAL